MSSIASATPDFIRSDVPPTDKTFDQAKMDMGKLIKALLPEMFRIVEHLNEVRVDPALSPELSKWVNSYTQHRVDPTSGTGEESRRPETPHMGVPFDAILRPRRWRSVSMSTIVCAIVSTWGFADRARNDLRMALASEIADAAKELAADLVALPAGFLRARDGVEAQQLALALVSVFSNMGVALVGGIDASHKGSWSTSVETRAIQSLGLPFFVFGGDSVERERIQH